jgi:hypothetical protein
VSDTDFRRLISTLKRLEIVRTLPTFTPSPRPRRRLRPRSLVPVRDRPRARLPVLEHALREPQAVRWRARCARCGVSWRGAVLDTTQPAAVLATLAVMRVPCPVCWARTWASTDQATRDAWAAVDSWIVPRWR